jgi:hypothetical protein
MKEHLSDLSGAESESINGTACKFFWIAINF